MENFQIKSVKERVVNKLINLGWDLGTEYDMDLTVFVFQKPFCDNLHLWFGTKSGIDLSYCQYTKNPDMWPGIVFQPVKDNDNFRRFLNLDCFDANEAPIDTGLLSNIVLKWLLIPGAEVPNKWDVNEPEKASPRRLETVFQKAFKNNTARKAAKAAFKK